MIKPTIGRVIWFTPPAERRNSGNQPWPAFITYVHGDRMINVAGFDSGGAPFFQNSVTLLQDDDRSETASGGFYASWMPFQVQSANTGIITPIGSTGEITVTPQAMGLIQPFNLRDINPDKWLMTNLQLQDESVRSKLSPESRARIQLNAACNPLGGGLSAKPAAWQGYETADGGNEGDRLKRANHTTQVFDVMPSEGLTYPYQLNREMPLAKRLGIPGKHSPNIYCVRAETWDDVRDWIEYNRDTLKLS